MRKILSHYVSDKVQINKPYEIQKDHKKPKSNF